MAFFPPNSHNNTTTFMFQTQLEDHHDSSLPSTSLNSLPSLPPPQHLLGVAPLMVKRSMSLSGIDSKCCEEELWDDSGLVQFGEKKKRLNVEQVKALERSFEMGNKLEAERKVELAKSLGLQPRQIAIWFQNRRARWKTKHLENEFQALRNLFEAAKADHHALKAHNHKLQAQLQALKSMDYCEGGTLISLKQEAEDSWTNGSDNNNTSDNINLDLSRSPLLKNAPASSQNGKSLQSTSITQLLEYSSSRQDNIQDEGLCNIFHHNIDEQQNLWPWPEQQHFH